MKWLLCCFFCATVSVQLQAQDSDGDGVSDFADLDDDNDGILDDDENACDIFDVLSPDDTDNPNSFQVLTSNLVSTEGNTLTWNTDNPHNISNTTSFTSNKVVEYRGAFGNPPGITTALSFVTTITFSTPTTNFRILAYDFDGPTSESLSNFSIPPSSVSSNGSLSGGVVTSNTANQDITITWEFESPVSSLSFTANRPNQNFGIGFDVGFVIECDTDGDGVIDRLDLDSDGDSCFDALEGGSNFTDAAIDGNGRLTGGVDANGVPTSVSGGQSPGTVADAGQLSAFCAAQDDDGDGVNNSLDAYPQDGQRAANSTYPSEGNSATLAFEDLWPFIGDYDFNDTAVDYSITTVTNAQNEVVDLVFNILLTNNGGAFSNGLAFELEGVPTNAVNSVSGQVLSTGVFSLSANGTEAGQTNAVIPIFDNDNTLLNQQITVTVNFTPQVTVGVAPFDPFLVIDGTREMEVHLIGQDVTDLGNATPTVSGSNADPDGNFATDTGLPWAMNIIGSIPLPTEKTPINEGFVHFNEWATSGGVLRSDWYQDISGYRVAEKLQQ